MPSERLWTEWRLNRLRELAPTTSAANIAAILGGVTRNAVISAMHRYGIAAANKMGHHHGSTTRKIEKKRERKRAAKLQKQEPAMGKKLTDDELYKPQPDTLPPTVRAVPFMELQDFHCREVVGHDGHLALYCGARRFHKSTSYCRHHAQRNQPGLFLKYMQAAE